jgi:hypothetical protein
MTPVQKLYYALGELAYAVASVDGKVNEESRTKFQDVIETQIQADKDFDISGIIFSVMESGRTSSAYAYEWAMKQIAQNKSCLTAELMRTFEDVLVGIAKAGNPISIEKAKLVDRYRADILAVKGEPADRKRFDLRKNIL